MKYEITKEQLEEMVNFMKNNPKVEFYTEEMNDGENFLSCTFFKDKDTNASGFWELSEVINGKENM